MNYKLYEQIGAGTHGRVYRAFHYGLNKPVAMKIMKKRPVSDMEIQIIQDLQDCRNIVKYYDHALIDSDTYAFAMEYIPGCNGNYLVDLAKHGIHLTEKELRIMAKQICECIYDCHERGVVYGDIKAANIIFTPPYTITLVDVGCARYGTEFEKPIGTPIYFAPEKFKYAYGLKSDVWSIGILLYELVCGHHPFSFRPKDKDYLEAEILNTDLTFHHPCWDAMSNECTHLISEMLHKDPHYRYSMQNVLEHPWWSKQI